MNEDQNDDKLSMGLSVLIALCVVFLFCAISIVIVENMETLDTIKSSDRAQHVNLPNNRDFGSFTF